MLAHDMAAARSGRFLLRIEDTDISRARPHWEELIYEDLRWLGLEWETPVLRQSDHLPRYDAALIVLANMGLIYPCSCRRSDIRAALSAPQEGVAVAPAYPGTCRSRPMSDRQTGDALRLNVVAALDHLCGKRLAFEETSPSRPGEHLISRAELVAGHGDPVLGRKEIETPSYLLSAVIDDAEQEVTDVVRGEDLFDTTAMQVLLQALLELPTPVYHHHRLIRDENGKRLAKRDDARAISKYRSESVSPTVIRQIVGLA